MQKADNITKFTQNKIGDLMTIIIIRSIIIYLFVVLSVRIMGKRQIGELKPHELVITILISAVATIPLQEISIPLTNSIFPIMIFVSLEIIGSALSMKSIKLRNLLQGKPMFIIKDGILQQKQMRRLRFTMDDIIDALRQAGVFDISTVENAVVETNGSLSVQTKAECAPLTPDALGLEVEKAQMPITIVMDSKPVTEYFGEEKINKNEIDVLISSTSVNTEDIMLLTIDNDGNMYMIERDRNV